ncbi:MAG TPA: cupin domain-containing protein [Burkholderiaceae bacterium]|nr:cupin domain-containing protein [Burkholderiaceae bacterium]
MAQTRARSGQVVRLRPFGTALAGARTQAVLKAAQLEVVRLVLQRGAGLPIHAAPGEITLLGLEGRVELGLPTHKVELGPGDFIHLAAGEPHALHALEAVSLLLTLRLATAD